MGHYSNCCRCSIVAVHGLGSNLDWAWTDEVSGAMWLKDFLPKACPRARIMAFNHNSAWNVDAPVKSVEVCGQQLLDALNYHRAVCIQVAIVFLKAQFLIFPVLQETNRPIIFIGHSFGGIIIKKVSI